MRLRIAAAILTAIHPHHHHVTHRSCPRTVSTATNETVETVKAEIRRVWGAAAPFGLRVAARESRYRTGAINHNCDGTNDYGIFQINSGATLASLGLSRASALNYRTNIAAAHLLYMRRGPGPWRSSSGIL